MIFISGIDAQNTISTDRPSQSYGTTVLGKGVLLVETGMLFKNTKNENDENIKLRDFGTTFIRIGTGANLEFQIATSITTQDLAHGFDKISGLSPIKLGAKFHIADERGAWPEIAFIGNIVLPWIGEDQFRPKYVTPDFRFIFLHTISDKFTLGYNIGMQWDGDQGYGAFVYTLVFGASITDKLGGFVEVFGDLAEEKENQHAFDLGFTYLISPIFQIDISYGYNYSGENSNYLNIGAAYQFGNSDN